MEYGFYKKIKRLEKEESKPVLYEQKPKKKVETEVDKEIAFYQKMKADFGKVGEKKLVLQETVTDPEEEQAANIRKELQIVVDDDIKEEREKNEIL